MLLACRTVDLKDLVKKFIPNSIGTQIEQVHRDICSALAVRCVAIGAANRKKLHAAEADTEPPCRISTQEELSDFQSI
jgi:hypothetical protein